MKLGERLRYIPMIMQAYADAQTKSFLQRQRAGGGEIGEKATTVTVHGKGTTPRKARRLPSPPASALPGAKQTGSGSAPRGRRATGMEGEIAQLLRELRQTRQQLKQLSNMREHVSALEQQLQKIKELQATGLSDELSKRPEAATDRPSTE